MFSMSDGKLDLMETDYIREVNPFIMSALATNKSIPLFLANITSELFEKSTLMPY